MDRLAKIFGRQLRLLRKEQGLTQEQLGRSAKLDYKHIGSIERGEKTPSFDAIERIAKALDAEYFQFFLNDRVASKFLVNHLKELDRRVTRMDRARLERFSRETAAALLRLNAAMPE